MKKNEETGSSCSYRISHCSILNKTLSPGYKVSPLHLVWIIAPVFKLSFPHLIPEERLFSIIVEGS